MPFAEYADFDDCVAKNSDKEDPKAYCGSIEAKVGKRDQVIRLARVLNDVRKHYGPGNHPGTGTSQSEAHGRKGEGKWDADNPGPAERPRARSGRPQFGRSHLERPAHAPRREDTDAWDAAEDKAVTAMEDRRDMLRREHERSPYQTWSRNPDKGSRLDMPSRFERTDDEAPYQRIDQAYSRVSSTIGSLKNVGRDQKTMLAATLGQVAESVQNAAREDNPRKVRAAAKLALKDIGQLANIAGGLSESPEVDRLREHIASLSYRLDDMTRGSTEKAAWSIPVRLTKSDPDKQLVFGWASVAKTPDGLSVIDVQGDLIPVDELETAAYSFTAEGGTSGAMHKGEGFGTLVESVVFTDEKLSKMGVPPGTVPTGWWVGFHLPTEEFAKVKGGQYKMFSIQGRAIRVPEEDES